jgi:hypothetical protein
VLTPGYSECYFCEPTVACAAQADESQKHPSRRGGLAANPTDRPCAGNPEPCGSVQGRAVGSRRECACGERAGAGRGRGAREGHTSAPTHVHAHTVTHGHARSHTVTRGHARSRTHCHARSCARARRCVAHCTQNGTYPSADTDCAALSATRADGVCWSPLCDAECYPTEDKVPRSERRV